MSGHPPSQRQLEFVAYVRTHGPITPNQATDYVRLNNLHEPHPYTLSLLWLKAAIETHKIQIYRDAHGAILYTMPRLKTLQKPNPPTPVQTDLARKAPPTTAQLAAQAAALATLDSQPLKPKEPHK